MGWVLNPGRQCPYKRKHKLREGGQGGWGRDGDDPASSTAAPRMVTSCRELDQADRSSLSSGRNTACHTPSTEVGLRFRSGGLATAAGLSLGFVLLLLSS